MTNQDRQAINQELDEIEDDLQDDLAILKDYARDDNGSDEEDDYYWLFSMHDSEDY